MPRKSPLASAFVLIAALIVIASAVAIFRSQPAAASQEATDQGSEVLITGLLNFDFEVVNSDIPIWGRGGTMALTSRGILIARAPTGGIYRYDPDSGEVSALSITLPPLNDGDVPPTSDGGNEFTAGYFRYNGLTTWQRDGQETLVVSYSHYDAGNKCFTMRLAEAPLEGAWDQKGAPPLDWRVVYETEPCIPINDNKHFFAGHQAGGRMAISRDGESLYLTVGDFEYDGTGGREIWPQMQDTSYGKVFRFGANWEPELISLGHRNPQGIAITAEGTVYSVEHSARGGDELNLITEAANYGWPLVNLGVDYYPPENDGKVWDQNPEQGRHNGYQKPLFAWIPSIAPSSVAVVEGVDPRWDGDLLVGALAGTAIHRLRIEDGRVLYDERIPMDARVRHVVVVGGAIHILFDDGRIARMTPRGTPPADGGRQTNAVLSGPLQSYRCLECHSQGPRLSGVVGRDIASDDSFDYSDALRNVPGDWTVDSLREFLSAPSQFAPGTTMPDPGIPQDRLDSVIEALEAM